MGCPKKFKCSAGIIAGEKLGHALIVQEFLGLADEEQADGLNQPSALDDAYASPARTLDLHI
jgi:hypothetical protein